MGLLLPSNTDCCLTLPKNALFKCWAFMAGDAEGKGQRPGQRERLGWSGGSEAAAKWVNIAGWMQKSALK